MNIYNTQVEGWTQSLSSMTIVGTSIAIWILTPSLPLVIPMTQSLSRQERSKIITTIPDGITDPRTHCFSTSQGLSSCTSLVSGELHKGEESQRDNLPQMVREISGLPVDILADLVGVSRVAYHKWLAHGGVKPEHVAQLTKLLDTFQTLRNLRIPDLRVFLESAGPFGKPLDLLASGDIHAVIGLALRSSSQPGELSTLSKEARQVSGLRGWVRPAKKLNWNTPRLTGVEREDALDLLSPKPLPADVFVDENSDEDH